MQDFYPKLTLLHLHCLLTDIILQSNLPPETTFRVDLITHLKYGVFIVSHIVIFSLLYHASSGYVVEVVVVVVIVIITAIYTATGVVAVAVAIAVVGKAILAKRNNLTTSVDLNQATKLVSTNHCTITGM